MEIFEIRIKDPKRFEDSLQKSKFVIKDVTKIPISQRSNTIRILLDLCEIEADKDPVKETTFFVSTLYSTVPRGLYNLPPVDIEKNIGLRGYSFRTLLSDGKDPLEPSGRRNKARHLRR